MATAPPLQAEAEFHWFGTDYAVGDTVDTTGWSANAIRQLLSHAPVTGGSSGAGSITEADIAATGVTPAELGAAAAADLTTETSRAETAEATKASSSALTTETSRAEAAESGDVTTAEGFATTAIGTHKTASGDHTAANVAATTSGLVVVTHTNVQGALADLDAGFNADSNGHVAASRLPATAQAEILAKRTGAIAETWSRYGLPSFNSSTCQSGRLYCTGIPLTKGQLVSNITWLSSTTALATPSNWWFVLFTPALAEACITADQTTAAWAASTEKTLAVTSPYTVAADGLYYLGIMMNASTPATILNCETGGGLSPYVLTPPIAFLASGTGYTTPATAPNPVVAASGFAPMFGWVS